MGQQEMIQKRTVGIVGAGNVGVAAAYAMFLTQTVGEIILIDKETRRTEGEAMDLMHGQPYVGNITVHAGDYPELEKAQVVVITAGTAQRPGETRMDLLNRNISILKAITPQIDRYAPDAILIVASNPVDILTFAVQQLSARSNRQIIGTGTMLDTARFRALLGSYYGIDPRSVHANIIGEHGDTEVPVWSSAYIGSLPIVNSSIMNRDFDPDRMQNLFEQVRNAAYAIIKRKGYTNTAIGVVIAKLVEAIVEDQKRVLTVSSRLNGEYGLSDICLSLPCVIGFGGVEAKILPKLSPTEAEGLERSATFLRQKIDKIMLDS